MTDKEERKPDQKKRNVITSDKRDAKKALEYWSKDRKQKAKPVPQPKPKKS